MLSSAIPTKFNIPFADSAGAGFIRPVPEASQIGVVPGAASLTDGFPPLNFDLIAAGGIPPWGADMNGLMNVVTAWLRFIAAGGAPVGYDAAFSIRIGGYPAGALLKSASAGHYWISTTENNVTDPDTGGAGWTMFPDALIQIQGGNWCATDVGAVNHYKISLVPTPASEASIVGAPIRFLSGHANTIVAPDITINAVGGSFTATMINSSGLPLLIGQISRVGQVVEGFLDGVYFQVTSPGPTPPNGSAWVTGVIYEWTTEVAPLGTLECNGAEYPITSYPNLFNVIGWRFGGDGASTFRVPDKRGAFTRGWDHGRGLDPNASTRTSSHLVHVPADSPTGAVTGDHVGTWEWQSINLADVSGFAQLLDPSANLLNFNWVLGTLGMASSHSVIQSVNDPGVGAGGLTLTWGSSAPYSASPYPFPTSPPQGSTGAWPYNHGNTDIEGFFSFLNPSSAMIETRPINIDMMYIIAY